MNNTLPRFVRGNSATDALLSRDIADIRNPDLRAQVEALAARGRIVSRPYHPSPGSATGLHYVTQGGALRPLAARMGHYVVPGVWSGPRGVSLVAGPPL